MIVYVASPYSTPNNTIREHRFRAACCYCAHLVAEGKTVFSPIVHSHPICEFGGAANDHEVWMRQDLDLAPIADCLHVLRLPGWRESRGVAEEITWFEQRGRPVMHVQPTASGYEIVMEDRSAVSRWEESALQEAHRLISGDRRHQYGSFPEEADKVALVAGVMRNRRFDAHDVTAIQVATKLVREANKHKRDNLVDAAGYIGLWQQVHERDGCAGSGKGGPGRDAGRLAGGSDSNGNANGGTVS